MRKGDILALGVAHNVGQHCLELGTLKNPLRWTEGNEVKAGYHYTDGTHIYVALEDGVPTGIEDETYFTEV